MQKLALLVCISLTICSLGFLFRSEAIDADSYIIGQKLIYAFVTHAMFLMLLFILEYCRLTIPRIVRIFFCGLNFLITFVVLTLDYHSLFYKDYWVVMDHGNCVLEKEYGFMHTVAILLFAFYMISALVITIFSTARNMRTKGKYMRRLMLAVSLPCISYIIPKLTGIHNDLQPIAFAAFSLMVLYMIYKNNLYDIENIAARLSIDALDEGLIVFDNDYNFKGANKHAYQLFPVLEGVNIDTDIRVQAPLIARFIDGELTEYRDQDSIYELTICPINETGLAKGLVVKLEDVTIQRNYTELLQATKAELESEVITLTNYSYTDDLTGLRNRRCFEDALKEIRELSSIDDIAIGSVDINGLKDVNDARGHAAGDELIVAAARLLDRAFSKYGKVFRTGGDEFFIILPTTPDKLDEIISELAAEADAWRGELAERLSFSYGFAYARDKNSENLDELLIEADQAMYSFKRAFYSQAGNDRRRRANNPRD